MAFSLAFKATALPHLRPGSLVKDKKTKTQRSPPSTSPTGRSWTVVLTAPGTTSTKRECVAKTAYPAPCHPTNTVTRVHRLQRCPMASSFCCPGRGWGPHGCVPNSTVIPLSVCVLVSTRFVPSPPGWMLWMRRHVAQQRSCRQKAYRLEVSAEVLLRLQRRPLHLVELMREFAAQDPRRLLTYRIRSFL